MRTKLVVGAYPFDRCALKITLSDELSCEADTQHSSMLRIETGAASTVTYITAQDCRALSVMLSEMAESLDVLTANKGEAA